MTIPDSVNRRLAYVALSRARHDTQIYTDNAANLGERLGREVSKTIALEHKPVSRAMAEPSGNQKHHDLGAEKRMTGFELILPFLTTDRAPDSRP